MSPVRPAAPRMPRAAPTRVRQAERFRAGAIYTRTGPMLLSVNPFRPIAGLYGPDAMAAFRGGAAHAARPHVYAVAEEARQALLRDGADQSIVISGALPAPPARPRPVSS
jgi:myosin heavy subunit